MSYDSIHPEIGIEAGIVALQLTARAPKGERACVLTQDYGWFMWDPTSTASQSTGAVYKVDDITTGRWLAVSALALDSETVANALVDVTGRVSTHKARAALTANVNTASCSTSQDGLTLVADDRILLTAQSTGAQNGIYVVGTPAGGLAALSRASDWASGQSIGPGTEIAIAAGTAGAGRTYKITNVTAVTVATDTPTFDRQINTTGVSSDLAASLTGAHAAVLADDAVVGGVPVVINVAIADGVTADKDVVLTHKTEIVEIVVQKRASAGGANDKITVKNGSDAVSDAMDINVADKVVVRAGTIDDAFSTIAAAGTLRITKTKASANNVACQVTIFGIRRT